jgi:hypothetical protein
MLDQKKPFLFLEDIDFTFYCRPFVTRVDTSYIPAEDLPFPVISSICAIHLIKDEDGKAMSSYA